MTRLEAKVAVYSAENFPQQAEASSATTNVDLVFTGSAPWTLEKLGNPNAAIYRLIVEDVQQLGFGWDYPHPAEIVRDLVLALNLVSAQAVFSLETPTHPDLNVVRRHPPDPEPEVRREEGHVHIHVSSTIRMRDSVSIEIGMRVILDVHDVLETFRRIRKARAAESPNSPYLRALSNFMEATKTWDHAAAVRSYSAAAELATNAHRPQHLREKDLYNHYSRLAGLTAHQAEDVRVVYNRTKHADRNQEETSTYEQTRSRIATVARDARTLARTAILATLP